MSTSEDAVASFAVGPVGSADDWEALKTQILAFHGVSWQRRKDINDEDCERTWRALSGNSTPNDFAQSSIAFSGVWSASIRQDVYHTIGKLCVCKAGKAASIQPRLADVHFDDDPVQTNSSFRAIAFAGAPGSGKSTTICTAQYELQKLGFTVLLVKETATSIFNSIGGYDQAWAGTRRHVDLQADLLDAQIREEKLTKKYAACKPADQAVLVLVDSATASGRAYCTQDEWEDVLQLQGVTHQELLPCTTKSSTWSLWPR